MRFVTSSKSEGGVSCSGGMEDRYGMNFRNLGPISVRRWAQGSSTLPRTNTYVIVQFFLVNVKNLYRRMRLILFKRALSSQTFDQLAISLSEDTKICEL